MRKKLVCCYGTRPEFIKIAPVVLELKKRKKIETVLICSGQHQELLSGLGGVFRLVNQFDLNVRTLIGKTDDLSTLGEGLLVKFSKALDIVRPDGVLVQGDAASAFYAALTAFHLKIPIFYVESGLRTYDLDHPFPEEGYRQMISRLATVHFVPTKTNYRNLISEKILTNKIYVVGNTVVDALKLIENHLKAIVPDNLLSKEIPQLSNLRNRKLVVVEVHRRENYGQSLIRILKALVRIEMKNKDYFFVFPTHPSHHIRPIVKEYLDNKEGFAIIEPPVYLTFLALLNKSSAIITDSGGLQEEAPSLGIPVLVVRYKTERTEGLEKDWSFLVKPIEQEILTAFDKIKKWKMPKGGNPYGDGKAAGRIAKIIYEQL